MYKYEKKNIEDLNLYANNPRTHSDKQISQLVGSILEFGFTNPILIDENNNIIAGHGRLEAATLAGLEQVPCIIIDGLSEEQQKALVIADNQHALNAGWDLEVLKTEIESLGEAEYDLDLLGFDERELEKILNLADIPEIDEESNKEDSPQYVICPHCGKEFENK